MLLRSKAPVRICDLGGWSDTWFAKYGVVLNVAVTPAVEVQIEESHSAEPVIEVCAENYSERYVYNPKSRSKYGLIDACIGVVGVFEGRSLKINVFSQVPGGAATGTSASLTVALLAGLKRLKSDSELSPYALYREAHQVETEILGPQSGIQDQIAAAYGGVNLIEMNDFPDSQVRNLELAPEILQELESRFVLVYLGKPHSSSEVHKTVIASLDGTSKAQALLEPLRVAAMNGAKALQNMNLSAFGQAMLDNLEGQCALHPDLVPPAAHEVGKIAMKYGSLGWKVNGAGGDGGSVTILGPQDLAQRREMIQAIQSQLPAVREIPIALSRMGAHTWKAL